MEFENIPERSSKRRKTKTTRFDFDEMDNEEQILLQQALKVSKLETKRAVVNIPEAPVFRPTLREFLDPLEYIKSIRSAAEPHGICKIVPPAEWNPPCQISLDHPGTFATKKQQINVLQQGQGFDDGERYTIADYKAMADAFYESWRQQYYSSSSSRSRNSSCTERGDESKGEKSRDGGGSGSLQFHNTDGVSQSKSVETEASKEAASSTSSLIRDKDGFYFETIRSPDDTTVPAPAAVATMNLADLSRDYWNIVETGAPEVAVEYGNDIDTSCYGSGFISAATSAPVVSASVLAGAVLPASMKCENATTAASAAVVERKFSIETFAADQATAEVKEGNVALAAAAATKLFDNEFYSTTGWNLNNIPSTKGSLLQHLRTPINGINVPWLYIGMLFTSFCWHNEDNYFYSINYSHFGAVKQWYGVPGDMADRFEKVSKDFLLGLFRESPDLLHHMTTQISPSLLAANGVPVYKMTQEPGTFIVTFPKSFHAGFSYGFNVGEAVNFATSDWLLWGGEAEERYRMFGRESVFSHQRLLFTLLHHRERLRGVTLPDLAREVCRVLDEELATRPLIYKQGVKDLRSVVALPPNNFNAIDDNASQFDDMRLCCVCKQICVFTAVGCECDQHRVSCIRHYNHMCKCPGSKKFMLEWAPDEYFKRLKNELKGMCR